MRKLLKHFLLLIFVLVVLFISFFRFIETDMMEIDIGNKEEATRTSVDDKDWFKIYQFVVGIFSDEVTDFTDYEPAITKDEPIQLEQDPLYDSIYNALINIRPKLNVSLYTTNSEEGWETLKKVLSENPELYYFEHEGSLFWSDGRFDLKYKYPKSQIVAMNKELEQISDIIISENINDNMNDYEKVKAIHDYIVLNTAYDYENYKKNTVPDSSFDIYGTLINGTAVCEGYADSLVYLLDKIGIESKFVSGKADGGAHAWNKVKVNGKWYNVDATWDDPVPDKIGRVKYNYFLIPDRVLAKDHSWDDSNLPDATDTTYFSKAVR